MNTVKISDQLPEVNADIFTSASAIIGIRGSGKTNDGVVLAEQAIAFGVPIAVVDPTGVWFGLKSSCDGKSPGLPVYVFGGEHADVPLEETAGTIVARFVVDRRVPVILDVSLMRKAAQRRFVADFAEALYDLKARHRDPLLIILDEVARFCPQRVEGDVAKCVGAVEDIVALGRSRGLGCVLIGQRPATINKNVLTQADNLFAMRTVGTPDRKALDEWVTEAAGEQSQRDEMVKNLASLKQGEGYFWSPSLFGVFRRVKFAARATFDSSRTPKVGEKRIEPKAFAPVDLDALSQEITATVERAKAEDPKTLKAEIAKLRAELAKRPTEKVIETVTERVEVPVLSEAERKTLQHIQATLERVSASFIERLSTPLGALDRALEKVAAVQAKPTPVIPVQRPVVPRQMAVERPRIERVADSAPIGKGERATLAVVAQYPNGASRELLTIMTGYKRSSRDAYIQRLRTAGYVDVRGSAIVPTQDGIDALGKDYEPLPTGEELRAHWLGKLPEGERAVLSVLFEAYPNAVERAEIDNVTGYKRSSRDAYIQRLKQRLLVDVTGGGVKANDDLFQP